MVLITRSAMIQARVVPWVKHESRQVLEAMGLTLSEAMDLFLRNLIAERKLPFEIAALDMSEISIASIDGAGEVRRGGAAVPASQKNAGGGSGKKNLKRPRP